MTMKGEFGIRQGHGFQGMPPSPASAASGFNTV
jgi:hypothetical protein